MTGPITEIITFKFDNAEQQRRFHAALESPVESHVAVFEALAFLNDIVGDLHETGKTSDTRLSLLQQSVDRLREVVSA